MSIYYRIREIKETIKMLDSGIRHADIFQFKFTVRVCNALKYSGIKTLDDILQMTDREIHLMHKFGRKSVNDLIETIAELKKKPSKFKQSTLFTKAKILPDYSDDSVAKAILDNIPFNSSTWLGSYLEEHSDYLEYFDRLNIKNDHIYVIERKHLPEEIRDSADNFRFEVFLPYINKSSHLHILSIAPVWLLNTEIERTQCSIRLRNVMRNEGLVKFSNLLEIVQNDLLRMPNLGRKSFFELPEAIIACCNRGLSESANKSGKSSSLKELFLSALEELLNERQRYVLGQRSGVNGKSETLDVIAKKLNVTRERVRQIEIKSILIIRDFAFWVDKLEAKLQIFFEYDEGAIYADRIGLIDPWFCGFEDNIELFIWVIENFCRQRLFILQIDDKEVISNIDKRKWGWIKSRILSKIKNSLDLDYTRDSIKVLVRYEIKEYEAFPFLIEALYDDIIMHCNFSHKDDKLILSSIR